MLTHATLIKAAESLFWFLLLAAATFVVTLQHPLMPAYTLGFSLLFAMGPVMIYGRQEKSPALLSLGVFWLLVATALLTLPSEMTAALVLLAIAAAWWAVAVSLLPQLQKAATVAVKTLFALLSLAAVVVVFVPAGWDIVIVLAAAIIVSPLLLWLQLRYRQAHEALAAQLWWPLLLSALVAAVGYWCLSLSFASAMTLLSAGFWIQIIFFYRHWLAERHEKQQLYQDDLEYQVQERTLELEITLRELQEKNDELTRLSSTDALTGTRNRRHFDSKLVAEARRCRREQTPLSVAMIDIDHFKAVNDNYGHAVGDTCIRHVATVLKLLSRRSADDVCRYGGEEFALILPNTDSAGALTLVESIREKVAELPLEVDGHVISLTVSIGVCSAMITAEEQEMALLAAADKHLYDAKRSGRNCVKAGILESEDE